MGPTPAPGHHPDSQDLNVSMMKTYIKFLKPATEWVGSASPKMLSGTMNGFARLVSRSE